MSTRINIESENLKDFKKLLKEVLSDHAVEEFRFNIQTEEYLYRAQLVAGLLYVKIPGSKMIDGEVRQISFASIRRKRYTIDIFLNKRLQGIRENIERY